MRFIPLFFLFLIFFRTYAEEISVDNVDIFSLSLEDLQTITVASLHKETVYSAPSSVTLVTHDQLKRMGITNLQNLLNFIPGFQSSRDTEQGTANRIIARGRSTALSESVLVLIDGQRLNDLYTGGISILNRMLTTNNIEKIEIIRGPGSALYGSNAFLGVINIITRTQINKMIFTANSIDGGSASLLFNKSFSKKQTLDLFLNIFKEKGEHYQLTDIYNINGSTHDPMQGVDAYLKYNMNNWLITSRYMKRRLNDFLIFGALGNDINQEDTSQWAINSKYSKNLSDDFNYSISLSHSKNSWQTLANIIPLGVEIAPDFSLSENFIGGPLLDSNSTNISVNADYNLTPTNQLSVGASYEKDRITKVATATTHDLETLAYFGKLIFLQDELSFNDKRSRSIHSIYLQDMYKVNETLQITTGVRYDKYNDFGDSLAPRLTLLWALKPKNSLKFIYGSAFRAPNFLELYDRNNVADFGNPNLKAEKVNTTEIAWLNSGENWTFEITAFQNKFDDLIELGAATESPNNPFNAPTFIATDGKKSQGIETLYQLKITDNLKIKALWNWFSKNSDINIGRDSGALIVDYQWENNNINVNSYYRAKNKNILGQNSYIVSNLNIRHTLLNDNVLFFSVNNIFNEKFRTLSNVLPTGVANRGRVFNLGIEINYL